MSQVYMIADTHFGHRNILKYRSQFHSIEEHNQVIINNWNHTVTKHDYVYVLGDVAFDDEGLSLFGRMNGRKHLILGNHDKHSACAYRKYFAKVTGPKSYHGCWLSHMPIHPAELRGKYNIHGHMHNYTIPDPRYKSVCVEQIDYTPVKFTDIMEEFKSYGAATELWGSQFLDNKYIVMEEFNPLSDQTFESLTRKDWAAIEQKYNITRRKDA